MQPFFIFSLWQALHAVSSNGFSAYFYLTNGELNLPGYPSGLSQLPAPVRK